MDKQISNMPILNPQLERYMLARKKSDCSIPFDILVNQKNSEKAESEKELNTKEHTGTEAEKTQETEKTEVTNKEKPETEEKEEESCDIAREVACAQIVWMTPEIVQSQEQVEGLTGAEELTAMEELTAVEELTGALAEVSEEIVVTDENIAEEVGEDIVEESAAVETETVNAPEQTEAEPVVNEVENTARTEQSDSKTADTPEGEENGGEAVVTETPLFKDVEAAPIKVAEAPAQTEEPQLENQVKDNLVRILESGENRMEIQLQPAALGKMTIELTQNANGTLSIILNAEKAQTRGLLEKTIGTLQEALAERGQQNVQIQVNRNEEAQRQEQQQQDLQDDKNGGQNDRQQRRHETSGEDFLQQLRLGLIDLQEEY